MTKINSLKIKNFKSINEAILDDCRRVNVLIGYPNVGKSNILEALGLLCIFFTKKNALALKELVRFEKLTQIFRDLNIKSPAEIEIDKNYTLSLFYENEKVLNFSFRNMNEKVNDKRQIGFAVENDPKIPMDLRLINEFIDKDRDLQHLKVKPYKFSQDRIFNQTYSALDLQFPFGKNLFELIANNSEIQTEFSELLRPYNLELVIDISENDVKISPAAKNGIIKTIPISLMAETLIRLIFFKTAIISNKNAVLLFEEPESHMFPPYIGKLTSDIIFDKNNNQYFIATHSPFVLNDFIEDMDREDLSIYVVGLKEGETIIKRLNDDEVAEVSLYGVDLFFNMESYLSNGPVGNA